MFGQHKGAYGKYCWRGVWGVVLGVRMGSSVGGTYGEYCWRYVWGVLLGGRMRGRDGGRYGDSSGWYGGV